MSPAMPVPEVFDSMHDFNREKCKQRARKPKTREYDEERFFLFQVAVRTHTQTTEDGDRKSVV